MTRTELMNRLSNIRRLVGDIEIHPQDETLFQSIDKVYEAVTDLDNEIFHEEIVND